MCTCSSGSRSWQGERGGSTPSSCPALCRASMTWCKKDVDGRDKPGHDGSRYPTISLTIGATLRPYNSMQRIIFSCESGPALYFMVKRDRSNILHVAAILCATVSGEPT